MVQIFHSSGRKQQVKGRVVRRAVSADQVELSIQHATGVLTAFLSPALDAQVALDQDTHFLGTYRSVLTPGVGYDLAFFVSSVSHFA